MNVTRLGPSLIEPVARIASGFASLLCNGFVIGAKLLENSITLAWLRYGDAMLVSEGLEL